MPEANKRHNGLDAVKGIALVAVITLHVIGIFLFKVDKNSLASTLGIAIDQFMRFAVPLFVAVSGYTPTLRYKDVSINYLQFLKKRVLRVIPWYLFWTLVIYLFLTQTH